MAKHKDMDRAKWTKEDFALLKRLSSAEVRRWWMKRIELVRQAFEQRHPNWRFPERSGA